MTSTNPHARPGFREEFDSAREKTVKALERATSGASEVLCGPLNRYGMFGWTFEATNSERSSEMGGDLSYGISYLRHMINQGFRVGIAAWQKPDRSLVCLKTWEPGEEEPPWPRNTDDAVVVYHEPPVFVRAT